MTATPKLSQGGNLTAKELWIYRQARSRYYPAIAAYAMVLRYRRYDMWHPCLGQRYTCWVGWI